MKHTVSSPVNYYSTNGKAPEVSLQEAVVRGLAPDGGLYVPSYVERLAQKEYERYASLSFQEITTALAKVLFGKDISAEELEEITRDAYYTDFGLPGQHQMIELVKVTDHIYALELFHGPTLAFKDVGARFMARLLGYFIRKEGKKQQVNVLVATSGDTGSAVANGFLGVEGIHVYVLYPKGKVSEIQEKQFTTLGQNITALEVDGTFDDCQALVKAAFMDKELNNRLKLTSANSINVARFMPQIFYYFGGYAQLATLLNQAKLPNDLKLVVSVPSGNLGNLTAGLYAKTMGLPIERFIAANNRNDVFYQYLQNGIYAPRPSEPTIANAMDVGNPSNFARILDLYDDDYDKICDDISGFSYTNMQIASTIRRVWKKDHYLLDPHGACAYQALVDGLRPDETGIFLATAHPAKFKDTVESIIREPIAIPAKLKAFMEKAKQSVQMSKEFDDFKEFLLGNRPDAD
ncbi:MAG: threonine synthase [Prevotellaceae bacterium]|jgi:threonine synthase|nr:threonine synthase [Prevotellaceae bacterium]